MKQIALERFEAPSATALHAADPDAEEAEILRLADEALALEAATHAEREARDLSILASLDRLTHAVAKSRSGAIQAFCADVGDSLTSGLASVVEPAFTSELAAASVELLDGAGIAEAVLRAPPDEADAIVKLLQSHGPRQTVTVTPDPALKAGEARLDWQSGGAVFDLAAWTQRIQQLLQTHIEARFNQGLEK